MAGMSTTAKKGWGTAPFAVDLVAVIALCKAFFVLFMGIIGVAASTTISNPFGAGMIVFAVVYGAIALMLVRGSRFARDVLALLSAVSAIIAIVWAFHGPRSALIEALVTLGFAILVLVLLFVPEGVKAYFRKA
jgi:hypothetical protein